MSSPPLNCFVAAARTASLIASITRSRSMPCSWQRASIFCAILVLMLERRHHCRRFARISARSSSLLILSNQIFVGQFSFACVTKFAVNVDFKIGFGDRGEGYLDPAAGVIVEN